ncbi:hypothetical protein CDL15_Pgr027279 [Punica granatum]|uniref:Uncharacterized protein n=1 Tax=Punica granatum TaxID=22663 RepID=A0A218XM77_PUNGR|nr:hypothetical protein CDL15_Pgr027279 [Punica granatum]
MRIARGFNLNHRSVTLAQSKLQNCKVGCDQKLSKFVGEPGDSRADQRLNHPPNDAQLPRVVPSAVGGVPLVQASDQDEQLINSFSEALRAEVRAVIKRREDALAKTIMDEIRGSEEDAPNRPVGLVCSKYLESPKKKKKVLKEESAS